MVRVIADLANDTLVSEKRKLIVIVLDFPMKHSLPSQFRISQMCSRIRGARSYQHFARVSPVWLIYKYLLHNQSSGSPYLKLGTEGPTLFPFLNYVWESAVYTSWMKYTASQTFYDDVVNITRVTWLTLYSSMRRDYICQTVWRDTRYPFDMRYNKYFRRAQKVSRWILRE